MEQKLSVYLSGEIHSNWREEIQDGVEQLGLPIHIYTPVTHHESSDNCGEVVLGPEQSNFWKDHKAARLNLVRIHSFIDRAEIVIVKFGEKYRQWNAAFDAGYAVAKGKKLIVIHPEEHIHALKEIDGAASVVCRDSGQALAALRYIVSGEL